MPKKDIPKTKEKWTSTDQKMLENLISKRMRLLPVLGHEIVDLVNQNEPRKETAKAAGSAA